MTFQTNLRSESIRGTNKRKLAEPLIYESSTWSVTVPTGFVSDGASVPWPFRMLIPRDGRYRDAAWVHDYLFSKRGEYFRIIDGMAVTDYTRQTANQMMNEIMQSPELRVKSWRRISIMLGLKMGSRWAWRR